MIQALFLSVLLLVVVGAGVMLYGELHTRQSLTDQKLERLQEVVDDEEDEY